MLEAECVLHLTELCMAGTFLGLIVSCIFCVSTALASFIPSQTFLFTQTQVSDPYKFQML